MAEEGAAAGRGGLDAGAGSSRLADLAGRVYDIQIWLLLKILRMGFNECDFFSGVIDDTIDTTFLEVHLTAGALKGRVP